MNFKGHLMAWIKVEEHVPPAGKIVIAYSAVFGSYHFAQWNGARGWLDSKGSPLQIITIWDDNELDMPFPLLDEPDEDVAKEYGFNLKRHGFYAS